MTEHTLRVMARFKVQPGGFFLSHKKKNKSAVDSEVCLDVPADPKTPSESKLLGSRDYIRESFLLITAEKENEKMNCPLLSYCKCQQRKQKFYPAL